jgi:hypothetical protein
MLSILTITNILSKALQQKDILNVVNCVGSTRSHLDKVRRDDWEKLLGEVYVFCSKHSIAQLEMDDAYIDPN